MLFDDIDFLSESKKNDSNLKIIYASIKTHRFAHAYLFCGKNIKLLKRIGINLAASINCSSGGCGKCRICKNTLKGIYENLMVVVPDGNFITKDKITKLQAFMSKSSYSGGYKICIIEAADLMNKSAANRLLKTLEDPPGEKSIFILLTEDISQVMATVSSRCMVFEWDFDEQGKINLDFDVKALSRKVLDGIKSMQKEPKNFAIPLDLSGEIISFLKDNALYLSDDFEQRLDAFRNTGATDSEIKKFEADLKAGRKRKRVRYFNLGINIVFDIITDWLEDLVAVKLGAEKKSLNFPDSYEFIQKNTGFLYDREIYKFIENIEKNRNYLNFSINHELVLDNTLLQIQALNNRSKTNV